jgi:hypothetical protein
MATPIFIKVVTDDNGTLAAATDADVVVARRDLVGDTDYPYDGLLPTFKHDANGHYVNSMRIPEALEQLFRNDLNTRSEST